MHVDPTPDERFDALLDQAAAAPFRGWDFGWLGDRRRVPPTPWDFAAVAGDCAASVDAHLDMDTGGGEWLSSLTGRARRTVATESWAPNVPVAAVRLAPLGIPIVQAEPAPDNVEQQTHASSAVGGRLPFADGSFELITNRHASFVPAEVARTLAPAGRFLTQQVDDSFLDSYQRLLGLHPARRAVRWNLPTAVHQLRGAGLEVVGSGAADVAVTFADVGAVAWYLLATPWTVPSFTIDTYRHQLERLHRHTLEGNPIVAREPLFWLEARRPE